MLWGIFFLYGDLLLSTRRFEVRDDSLTIDIPFRLGSRHASGRGKTSTAWISSSSAAICRADNASLQVYHQYPGEITIEREDCNFDPELAHIIIGRAKLKADSAAAKIDLNNLPLEQSLVLTWKK